MMWLLVPVAVMAVCWLLSLRRTPYALLWAAIGVPMVGLGMLEIAAAQEVHHTIAGMLAVATGSAVLPVLAVVCTEACASERGEVRSWRQTDKPQMKIRPGKWTWTVVTEAGRDDSHKQGVRVGVRCGDTTRWLGHADPLEDVDAFMELRVRADQAVESYNALKVQA